MNTIVIYNSKTGFTKKYGEWIAEELGCEAVPMKNAKNLANYDWIIFGGWLMAGKVAGLEEFKKKPELAGKKLMVYATGATDHRATEVVEKMKTDNFTEEEQKNIPFFYLEGGINYEDMGFAPKMLLKMMGKSLAKKKEKTPMEDAMAKIFAQSCDHSDREYIEPLVEMIRK